MCEAATVNGHQHKENQKTLVILCQRPTREFTSDLIGLLEVAADWTTMAITGRLVKLTHDAGLMPTELGASWEHTDAVDVCTAALYQTYSRLLQ